MDPSTFSKHVWTEKRRRRRPTTPSSPPPAKQHPSLQIISGMLPTLQALATLTTEPDIHKQGVCVVPLEGNADAASHLQTTLLEAYCREIGLKLLRMPVQVLRQAFGNEHKDLDCLLLFGLEDDNAAFFLESPE